MEEDATADENAMDMGFLGSLEPTAEDFMSDLLLQQLGFQAGVTGESTEHAASGQCRRCTRLRESRPRSSG